ncbi:MAG TPA: 50S ribosomal protein L6 [Nitrososphaeraceae archaeon]
MSISEASKDELLSVVEVPSGVTASLKNNLLSINGKLGTIEKDVTKLPVNFKISENQIEIRPYGSRKKDRAISNTCKTLVRNMMRGVQDGFTYKLKIVYAHFPISVKVKGNEVHVDNFFGERSSRVSHIVGKLTKVNVTGDDVIVEGPSLEDVSQTAANIESSTKVKQKDQRVFLDGLYIYQTHA